MHPGIFVFGNFFFRRFLKHYSINFRMTIQSISIVVVVFFFNFILVFTEELNWVLYVLWIVWDDVFSGSNLTTNLNLFDLFVHRNPQNKVLGHFLISRISTVIMEKKNMYTFIAFIFLCLKLLASFLFTNSMRYLHFIDVGFGIAVQLVTRLFVTVICLTNDKAERNDMRLRYWINVDIC